MPNPFKKERPLDDPYAVYTNDQRGWEWRVLSTRKMPENEGSPFDIWHIAAKSPFTGGSFERGDIYKSEVVQNGTLTKSTSEWSKHYG
jgi:hypothetical protein|tara:strand:+ start:141 stop:404 length:264 start_codon:yes stop_codon:yes gene_type:complete